MMEKSVNKAICKEKDTKTNKFLPCQRFHIGDFIKQHKISCLFCVYSEMGLCVTPLQLKPELNTMSGNLHRDLRKHIVIAC